jgi:hypothetical protein
MFSGFVCQTGSFPFKLFAHPLNQDDSMRLGWYLQIFGMKVFG